MSRHHLIRMACTAAAAVMAVFVPACSRTDHKTAGPPVEVTIAFATPPYTVLADVAQAKGYFRQEGLAVTPVFYSTGRSALNDVVKGKADFATVAETPIMFATMQGNPLSIIATIQTSERAAAICARQDRGIRVPHDLSGKTIGVPLGTAIEFFMDMFLETHGIARRDVRVVNLDPEEMPEALASGAVDALATFPPYLDKVQHQLGSRVTTFHADEIYKQRFSMVCSQAYVRRNPGAVIRLLRALVRAEELVSRDPANAQRTVAGFRGMDEALLKSLWPSSSFEVTLDQQLLLALEDESRWALGRGLTRGPGVPNYLEAMYLDGLLTVKPEAVTILR